MSSSGAADRKAPAAAAKSPLAIEISSGQTSAGSRSSAISTTGGSSSNNDTTKAAGTGSSMGGQNPQLQLVQRLPSLTGGTPRLVHKVETWLVQVRGLGCVG